MNTDNRSDDECWLIRLFRWTAVALTSALVVATVLLLYAESTWVVPASLSAEEAFRKGSIGTEAVPLPVLRVLPELFPEYFQPGGPEAGDWVAQFGFVRAKPEDELPIGFTLSNYRPKSGAPSPVQFVGFGCALCHTMKVLRDEGDREGKIVYGAGNASLNFLAWVEAFRASVLDEERLTPAAIEAKCAEKGHQPPLTLAEKLMIRLWLKGFRTLLQENVTKYDEPARGKEVLSPKAIPSGPSRTQPFRNLVRAALDRPAVADRAFTKFPAVFQQGRRTWAQFDGSIRDYHARSALAAYSAGATVQNLALPEIAGNVRAATDFLLTFQGPSFTEVFGGQLDPKLVERGRQVYADHCAVCHGRPAAEPGGWVKGKREGEVIPLAEIGTDSERVHYPHYAEIPQRVFELFPKRHPLSFPREAIRPGPEGKARGYIATPLESVFLRAPFLHNGSVLTLAELINLEPRRATFYRGNAVYDARKVGLKSPDRQTPQYYFPFDTSQPGNSNRGHNYPWEYRQGAWDREALESLLEYLKTF